MLLVPWQFIADWKCEKCGICCQYYSVVLNFREWLRITQIYGVALTASDLTLLYLRRKNDGSCSFLHQLANFNFCGLQNMKPKACKLWPFKVFDKPKYGYPKEAAYTYGKKRLFLYADSNCQGLRYGQPTKEFANFTLKEFTEIALGIRNFQIKSTAKINANIRRLFDL